MATLTIVATERPEPIRVIRERRWDKAQRRYVTVNVTLAMIEATKRREQYCSEFGIYA